ncbi:uncharacterized protein LOC133530325 isoform X3 [Cydia pomonella]|uniref:uncharacterized protein LOC133530325 isoform X3 n=1 Tax=Cydia pomonella TaxID=82600 RepID=UPI002ADE614F|nr:uncharacterized protein LOC133530325 isoform X3 [Cydia pomonella]
MSQVKHSDTAAADKPDRRRGAAGRAAALRRAPSDSDCSGETASLSADSGERRPPPPPPRGKTRNRRRGSEWEVLEGLKDGQRFERRPEVFNGFLHKKRKWPLKGWHKRFFVVDGGILVYARSPTDVARGRLHGSLDVGLSVISAKPRRRRIDIDADEFIYHLRAKTPDVFRTWLNVLKAHRLYRQHLLTFGARESVPKIHAPLDDLPPTDTSSRTSRSSSESFSSLTRSQTNPKNSLALCGITSSIYENKTQWKTDSIIPYESSDFLNSKTLEIVPNKSGGLSSTHCIEKRENIQSDRTVSKALSIDEQHMHSTDLDLNTLNSYNIEESMWELKNNKSKLQALSNESAKKKANSKSRDEKQQLNIDDLSTHNVNENSPLWFDNKDQTALFCFPRKRQNRARNEEEWTMQRSRKSTNLVKHRNVGEEPPLTKPLLRQMLLCKYKRSFGTRNVQDKSIICDSANDDDNKTEKSTQDDITASEFDRICEKLIFNLFDDDNINTYREEKSSIYVNLVVKELYDLKLNESEKHPIKILFKSLLQYFMKNTEGKFKNSIKRDVAINKPSITYFTRDKEISNINNNPKETGSCKCTQYSQDIEKIINSTIYACSKDHTMHGRLLKGRSIETDIAITKALIDNLDTSTKFSHITIEDINVNQTDSAELPLLQQYFKRILSETAIPKAVAKDFLNAYLDVLNHQSRSETSTESSDFSRASNFECDPICDIQTECVQKKISKSVSARKNAIVGDTIDIAAGEGPIHLKDILNRMLGFFYNKLDEHENENTHNNPEENTDTHERELKGEDLKSNAVISGTLNEHKIVIDLSKYDIDNIYLTNNTLGPTCITINLKEKKLDTNEPKLKNLSSKSCNENSAGTSDKIESVSKNTGRTYLKSDNILKDENTELSQAPNDEDVQTRSTSSGATSKANLHVDSDNSLDMPTNNNNTCRELPISNYKENTQCFFLSSIKEDVPIILDKIKNIKDSRSFVPGRFSPQYLKRKTQNEDFILRILEHLIVLSKDFPDINKDIDRVYMKIKKTCKKETNDLLGLGLLGRIYRKENSQKSINDDQIDSSISNQIKNIHGKAVEIAVNTSFIFPNLKMTEDKALSAIFAEALANIAVQTLSIDDEVKEELRTDVKEEWFKSLTQEYVKNSAIKCMLKKYHHIPQSLRIAHPIRARIPERFSMSNSSTMFNELSNLSPPLTASSRSQKKKEQRIWESNIEQLYTRTKLKLGRSESMTDSRDNIGNIMSDDLKTLYRCTSERSICSGLISPNGGPIRGPQAGFVSGTPGGRLAGWIVESGGPLESASRELGQAQLSVQQLQRLLDAMLEIQNMHHHDTDQVSLEGASPNVKKDRRKFGLRKKKSNSKCASVELAPPHVDGSSSHMALSALTAPPSPGGGASSVPNSAASLPMAFLSTFLASTLVPCAAARPQSLPGAEALGVGTGGGPTSLTSLTPDHQLREDFTILAKDLVTNLKTVVSTLVVERGRLRAAVEAAEAPAAGGVVAALRTNLSSALQQNSVLNTELRSRLSRIHDASDLAEISSVNNSDQSTLQQATRPFPQSLSYSSSCVSASEFFDAEEHDDELKPAEIITTDEAGVIELDGDSSSEAGSLSSEEGSASSDNSDASAVIPAERTPLQNGSGPLTIYTRRSRLPCPRPTPASPSLWNLLYKNIGKDLSQISMPVTINEPLNMLQRLCEELEYSELLDSASSCNNELERMSLIAAFAVSAYAASAHRAASKPFNPLLAETYEYGRGERDFRFIAEQVRPRTAPPPSPSTRCWPRPTSTAGARGTSGSLLNRYVRAPRRLQALQPAAGRDLRVRQGREGLPVHC